MPKVAADKKAKDSTKPKRALTPYNQFMKQELPKIKAEQPNITHKAAFKEAAQRWKVSPDNPKNKA